MKTTEKFRERLDPKIDSICYELGIKQLDMAERLGKDHPEYQRFLEEEYKPIIKKINSYLLGETDQYPV